MAKKKYESKLIGRMLVDQNDLIRYVKRGPARIEPESIRHTINRIHNILRSADIDGNQFIKFEIDSVFFLGSVEKLTLPEWKRISSSFALDTFENIGHRTHLHFIPPPKPASGKRSFHHIDDLRAWIESGHAPLTQPIEVNVKVGMFFACGLLNAGWWTKSRGRRKTKKPWTSEFQRWRSHGFEEWAPSWDFSWDLKNSADEGSRQHFFGQFGDGDEADSLPVYMTRHAALGALSNVDSWGGMPASIRCLLAHRSHFKSSSYNSVANDSDWPNWYLWIDPKSLSGNISRPGIAS